MSVKYVNIYSAHNLNSIDRNIDCKKSFLLSIWNNEYKAFEHYLS